MGHIRGRSHTVGMSLAGTVHLPVIICAFKKRPPLLASGSRSSVGGFPRGNGSARQPQQGSASANSSHVNVAFSYSGLLSPSACCDHFGQGAGGDGEEKREGQVSNTCLSSSPLDNHSR